jgi:RNA polymerase sigma factor (sigma-70 family)
LRSVTEREDLAGEKELPGLMIRYQQGDPVAVEELVAWLSPHLMRFFASPGIAKSDVDDLFQECWIRIHRSRQTYRPAEPLLPWIYAIARHTKLDAYRRRRRRESREVLVSEPVETGFQSPALPPEEPGRMAQLAGAIARRSTGSDFYAQGVRYEPRRSG